MMVQAKQRRSGSSSYHHRFDRIESALLRNMDAHDNTASTCVYSIRFESARCSVVGVALGSLTTGLIRTALIQTLWMP
jgi:hypothetical protein